MKSPQMWVQGEINLHKPIQRMVSENWMQNDAQMKSWEIYIHIIHYNLDLGGVTTLFLIVYIVIGHRDCIEIQKISGIRNLDFF
jgi:hypothetical protein